MPASLESALSLIFTEFPYSLDVTGAPGVSEGTICLYEEINGVYQKLGDYSVTFEKAE